MTGINGVDVSENNSATIISPGPQFIIAKATEGTTETDSQYNNYAAYAFEIGAQFGAYHFFHAENLSARAEADHFMTIAKPRSLLSLWIDYETYGLSGSADAEEIGFFIDEVKVHFPQAKVGIYCNGTGLARIEPFLAEIPFNGLWYANPSIPMTQQSLTGIEWQIHQYATVNGIDQDYWAWDLDKIVQYYTWQP